jgi:hypothetical protein
VLGDLLQIVPGRTSLWIHRGLSSAGNVSQAQVSEVDTLCREGLSSVASRSFAEVRSAQKARTSYTIYI